MPKQIDSLIEDIHNSVTGPGFEPVVDLTDKYSRHVNDLLAPKLLREGKPKALHASKLGKNCLRQMWYAQWTPQESEPLLAHTLIKFTYGDLVEEFALDLVRGAGHKVEYEQQRVDFPTYHGFTVSGRLDAVIDGVVVDVKSCSPYSYKDWANQPLTADNDSFGYRWQLHTYGKAAMNGQIKANTDRGYLLLMDKQNGHIGLSWVDYDWKAFDFRLKIITTAINDPTILPPRNFDAVEKDKLGNRKLCTECGYCDFKRTCWKADDIKGVVRAGKVVWLVAPTTGTTVKLKPGEEPLI